MGQMKNLVIQANAICYTCGEKENQSEGCNECEMHLKSRDNKEIIIKGLTREMIDIK